MTRITALLGLALVASCAGSTGQPANDPETTRKLEQASAKREAALKKLDAIAPDIRERCRQTDGDCMIDVLEQRRELTGGRVFYKCQQETDPESRAKCEEEAMVEAGMAERVLRYYEAHAWCTERMLACAPELVAAAEAAAKQARYEQRKQEIESSAEAKALRGAVTLAVAKVDFARSVLPPAGQEACTTLPEVSACMDQVQKESGDYDALLGRDADAYDAQATMGVFTKAARTEAGCYGPELECLVDEGAKYGAEKKCREAMAENLVLLEARQALLDKVPASAGQSCQQQPAVAHQERTVQIYRQYARRPITYFRLQLLGEFRKMHREQLKCLEGLKQK